MIKRVINAHYLPGTKAVTLFTEIEFTIDKVLTDTSGHVSYEVTTVTGKHSQVSHEDIATLNDPLLEFIHLCKLYMFDWGYRSLVLGVDQTGDWRSFMLSDHSQYSTLVHTHRDIRFKHYWAFPESEFKPKEFSCL